MLYLNGMKTVGKGRRIVINHKETEPKESRNPEEKNILNRLVPILILFFLLILTSMITYTSVRFIYGLKYQRKNSQVEYDDEVVNDNLLSAVFLDDPDTPEVDYIALRDFNTNVNKVNIIMFPTDAVVTLSRDLKKELSSISDSVESEMYLTDIGTYYGSSVEKYEQTVKAMEEIFQEEIPSYETLNFDDFISLINLIDPIEYELDTKLSYYDMDHQVATAGPGKVKIGGYKALGIVTFLDKDEKKKQLQEEKSTRNTEPDPSTTTNNTNKTISTKTESLDENGRIKAASNYLTKYVAEVMKICTRTDMLDYLNSYYQLLSTNGNVNDITKYIDNFLDLKEEKINFYTVKGSRNDDKYIINSENAASALTNMMEEVKEEDDTEEEKDIKDSKTLNIEILNGAYIQGIAAEWKKKLESEGFTIKDIDTYGSEAPKNGLIIVTEEGMGEDLKKYLPDAKIQVGELESDIDIQIILGRNNSDHEEEDEK